MIANSQAMAAAVDAFPALVETAAAYRGRLTESAETLRAGLDSVMAAEQALRCGQLICGRNATRLMLNNAMRGAAGLGGSTLPWQVVWEIFTVNLVVKALVSACSLPLIYVTPDRDWDADEAQAHAS